MSKAVNSKGFTVIEVLIVAVLLVAIGASAFYAGQHLTQTAKPAATSKPSPTPTESEQPPINESGKASGGYLEIKEWGVKLPATGALANLKYWQMGDGGMAFTTGDFYPKYRECDPYKIPLGTLNRYGAGDSTEPQNLSKVATIGHFDYLFAAAQTGCVPDSAPKADQQLNIDQHGAFANAVGKLMAN